LAQALLFFSQFYNLFVIFIITILIKEHIRDVN